MQTAIHQPHGETEWKLWHVVYWIITLTNIEAERSKRKLAVARWTWSRKDRRQGLVMWNTNTRVGQSLVQDWTRLHRLSVCVRADGLMELFASTGQMFIEPGYLLYIFPWGCIYPVGDALLWGEFCCQVGNYFSAVFNVGCCSVVMRAVASCIATSSLVNITDCTYAYILTIVDSIVCRS